MLVIIISFISYFSYGVTTAYSRVYESPSNFPAVTICNLVTFDTNANLNYLNKILDDNGISRSILHTNSTPAIEQIDLINEILKANVVSNKTITQSYLQSLGFSIDTLLISCYYNGLKCDSTNFNWYYDPNYGNCYIFNKDNGNVKKTSKYGPKYGLQLELFTGVPSKKFT